MCALCPFQAEGEGRRHPLKQTSLTDRLTTRLGAAGFGSLATGFAAVVAAGRSASAVAPTRPSANSRSSRAPGPIAAAACTGMALLVAHQGKAARQHAAIGQRRQQLAAVGDTRLQPLHRGRQRAPRALGQPLRAFAVARDGLALRLRVGEF